jgi:hypothetical protein
MTKPILNKIEIQGEPKTCRVRCMARVMCQIWNLCSTIKVFHLCHHSKKLPIALQLMSTPPGIPLQIFKDLHVYGECPTSMMFMGTIVGMPITFITSGYCWFLHGLLWCQDSIFSNGPHVKDLCHAEYIQERAQITTEAFLFFYLCYKTIFYNRSPQIKVTLRSQGLATNFRFEVSYLVCCSSIQCRAEICSLDLCPNNKA